MKLGIVKKLTTVLLIFAILLCSATWAYAETIEDRLQAWMEEIVEKYNASTPEGQENIQQSFSDFLARYGLDDIDLSEIADTDIGEIISNIGDNLALEDFFALARDAFASGSAMIQDALNGGLGTAFGDNTATTEPVTSPNVIVPNTSQQSTTGAAGIPETEPTTYNIGGTTAPDIIGAGVTTTEPVSAPVLVDEGVGTASAVVLVVLCVATLAVLIAIVVFFVLKRK